MTDSIKWSTAYSEIERDRSLIGRLLDRVKTSPRKVTRFGLPKSWRVLDLCCGVGRFVALFKSIGYPNVFGMDVSLSLVQQFPAEVEGKRFVSDALNMSVAGESLDAVFVNGALHHFPATEWERVVSEVQRVLRPGGVFRFIEPANTILRQACHWLVSSPLSVLFGSLRLVQAAWAEERPTYYGWLRTNGHFLSLLGNFFDIQSVHYDRMYLYVCARKRADGSDRVSAAP